MEMEAINQGKKIADMIRKGISKSKFILDIHLLFKRSNKAISNLLSSCKSNHITRISFISPTCYYNHHYHHKNTKEYEFSCSNSPITSITNFPTSASSLILRNKNLPHQRRRRRKYNKKYCLDHHDIITTSTAAAHNVLEMMDNNEMIVEGSPLVGFGGRSSPSTVRQLRITDSPFPMKEYCDSDQNSSVQVNEAAEDFINRFYMDLRLQKSPAMFESPYWPIGYI